MPATFSVSLVIPVYNESKTVSSLIETIKAQSLQPDKIIFVDGGSTDNTAKAIKELVDNDSNYQIIDAGRAMPGKGRNIGTNAVTTEWVAYTDAGITLHTDWLKELVNAARSNEEVAIVYGNYSPDIKSVFEQAATFAYVPPMYPGAIRGKSIASCLIKKKVWEVAGGFPDFRAAEDLIFMERAEQAGFKIATAPAAIMYWQLRPDWGSTFKKFVLYSKHNVWAGKQKDWHYGVLRQYLLLLPFLILGFFHTPVWFTGILVWLLARTLKRMLPHRFEFGIKKIINPLYFFTTLFVILLVDTATFTGWGKSFIYGKK
jgi:succinoglycan biosynthesis protein ExoA